LSRAIALIGNAPSDRDLSCEIDGCDRVVRMNNAYGLKTVRGAQTDDLVLVNCGGQMAEWLKTGSILEAEAFASAMRIVLPIAPEVGYQHPVDDLDSTNFQREASSRFHSAGKKVELVSREVFDEARSIVGEAAPSTGLITLLWLLRTEGDAQIHAFGFGFAGWTGHAFDRERAFFKEVARKGRLTLHPV
jgi:hypothetical protein